jgi:3-oxoadipate enol-lactonase
MFLPSHAMTHTDDFDLGLRNRRAVLGDAWVDQSLSKAHAFNAEWQDFITRYAWHEIWGRPGLDHRTRRLLVLTTTLALARWEEFELHIGAAIRGGVPVQEIQETLMQSAIYAGVPAANTAFKLAAEIMQRHGIEFAPRPLTPAHRVSTHRTFSTPELRVLRQGQGSPVLLSHALGLDVHMWDHLARELAPTHQVLRHDHRGHGESDAPAGPYRLDDLVDDAARVIREAGCGPVVWVGVSMGGMVGQALAIRHPELVRGLVIANSTCHYPEAAQAAWQARIDKVQADGLGSIADMVMQRYFTEPVRASQPELTQAARQTLLRADPGGYVGCCQAIARIDLREGLSALKVPTLVIAGRHDQGTPVAMSEDIASRIPGARLAVLEDASHISVLESPAAFTRLVQDFLQSLPSATA